MRGRSRRPLPEPGVGAVIEVLTVEQVEAREHEQRRRMADAMEATNPDLAAELRAVTAPFNRLQPKWEALKAMLQEGDQIVHFRSDNRSWVQMCGREGYQLVRDGRVIAGFITRMN